jgi:plastocyanin
MGSVTPSQRPSRLLVGAGLLLAIAMALLAGCGSDSGADQSTSGSTASAAGATAVTIKDYTYKPASITVPVGTTVKFTNEDSTPHTATSKQPDVFESGSIDTGKTGEVTLKKAGTFTYYCLFHPFMKGTIVVQ